MIGTGYTYTLMEDDLSFKQWVLLCCRNFGATLSLRDEPLEPIKEDWEDKRSDYHEKSLEQASHCIANGHPSLHPLAQNQASQH